MDSKLTTHSAQETHDLGRQVGSGLSGGENLLLCGDLGSGKTVFVQGLAEGLGVAGRVKSPTYTFLQEYEIPLRSTRLAHFDLYRLPDSPTPRQLETIELIERLSDTDVITAVEWADKIHHDGEGSYPIAFETLADGSRKIVMPKSLLVPAAR